MKDWEKEKAEHKWASKATAKRIARDHAAKKRAKQPQKGNGKAAIKSGSQDVNLMLGGMERITYQRR